MCSAIHNYRCESDMFMSLNVYNTIIDVLVNEKERSQLALLLFAVIIRITFILAPLRKC